MLLVLRSLNEHKKHMLKLMDKKYSQFWAQKWCLYRASDFFQDWWAEVTHGAKMVGHFFK